VQITTDIELEHPVS